LYSLFLFSGYGHVSAYSRVVSLQSVSHVAATANHMSSSQPASPTTTTTPTVVDTPVGTPVGTAGGGTPGRIAPVRRRREFYCEEIDQRTSVALHEPITAQQLVQSARSHLLLVAYFVLLVLAAMFVLCVLRDLVPLRWILPAVAVVSLITFHHLKL